MYVIFINVVNYAVLFSFVCYTLPFPLSSYNHMVYEFTLPMASGGCGSYTASGSGISGSGTK